jgi:DNA-binding NtrC family response regulator
MTTVLVVDDKEMMRDSVGTTLQRAGFTIIAAPGGQQALDVIARRRPDCVVTDLKMPGLSGLELLESIREIDDDLPVILMTAYGDVGAAVKAIKLGAFDFITKPFEGDELVIAVKRGIEHARLKRENAVLRLGGSASESAGGAADPQAGPRGVDRIVGQSPIMQEIKEQVRAIANSHGTVLITGESGVGKEVIARAIHDLSPRAHEPFLAMNCPALAESLLESELFGHEKGAFTGADRLRKGRFELADRGTLLLDEISEVSPQIQAKLLRVLQERSFERVGSSTTIGVDVRVIATTNRDLPREVAKGSFRQDLFFRLNVLPLRLPPLRERADDIPSLARHFAAQVAQREGVEPPTLTGCALDALCAYRWPGNVRELQNLVERAVVLARGRAIDARLLAPWLDHAAQVSAAPIGAHEPAIETKPHATSEPAAADTSDALGPIIRTDRIPLLEEIERQAIIETLERFRGHRQKTAEALGIGVRTLGLKLKKWKEERLVAVDL